MATINVTGTKTFGEFPITPSAAPTTDYQVANKKFVDDSVSTSVFKTGQIVRGNNGTGTQTVSHGVGQTPSLVIVRAVKQTGSDVQDSAKAESYGTATGTGDETCTYSVVEAGGNSGSNFGQDTTHIIMLKYDDGTTIASATLLTLDATNIVLNWDVNSATAGIGTAYAQWVAMA